MEELTYGFLSLTLLLHPACVLLYSDISKYNENLEEYRTYRRFLKKLSPPEWLEKQRALREKTKQAQSAEKDREKRKGQLEKRKSATEQKLAKHCYIYKSRTRLINLLQGVV